MNIPAGAGAALEHISQAVLVLDATGKTIYANPAALRLMDAPEKSVIGIPSFLLGNLKASFDSLLANNWEGEVTYMTVNTRDLILLQVMTRPLVDGLTRGVLAFISAINIAGGGPNPSTLEHLALANVGEAVSIADMNGTLLYVNSAWEKLYGYEAAEAIGKKVSILYPKDSGSSETQDNLASVMMMDFRGEVARRRKDGKIIAISMLANVVRKLSWEPHAYVVMSHEVQKKVASPA